MSLTICTGWSPSGYDQYGKRFLDTFAQHVSSSIRLLAYVEDRSIDAGPAELIDLWSVAGVREFIERHCGDAEKIGRRILPGWTKVERQAGYSMRFDAVKFCRQGFVPLHAAGLARGGHLAWFDADVVWKVRVRPEDIINLLPAGADVAHLGRPNWSEIGFQLYRLPEALPHLQAFRDFYATDAVFQLSEWHSAWVFDRARERTGIASHNLCPGLSGHVWPHTALGRVSEHLKGNRKYAGGRK